MPNIKTHDRITAVCAIPVAIASIAIANQLNNPTIPALSIPGFLFSGYMFGPDLDLRSRPYYRWGYLRWIWIPYQKLVPHRSALSHGPVVGTSLRLLYLILWAFLLLFFTLLGQSLWAVMQDVILLLNEKDWSTLIRLVLIRGQNPVGHSLATFLNLAEQMFCHPVEGVVLWIGLELGAASHYLADWIGSSVKRFRL
jgi:uncharacterized metal-binding protein